MKFLIFGALALVSCVLCKDAETSAQSDRKQMFHSCMTKSGLNAKTVKVLKEKPQYTPLTDEEQKFICCLAKPLIYEGRFIVGRIQDIVDEKTKGMQLNLEDVKTQCEATGAMADNLNTCPDTATFAHCFFTKIRDMVLEHKKTGTVNATSNVGTNQNTNIHNMKKSQKDTKNMNTTSQPAVN